ncbi:MAG: Gfo/Idh/MocA family oxidoreductase, partial [Gemmatimonadota bacterium]|nr:Gfo/Idh/MocA family oxidoreductase [Gemmatimonadota bacterium]
MANIPVGLIGCGGRGRGHVRALHALVDVELVAVCDPVAANREQVGDEWGVERRYADVEAMLDAEELAAAIVATPAHLNAEAALPCLKRGIDT